jgi:phosphatidylethanolamine-binding protein (PEBP) family uncharacterized protein
MTNRFNRIVPFVAASAIAGMCAVSPVNGAERATRLTGFMLTSGSFRDGGMMPAKHAADAPCALRGSNISPQLSWTNPPARTQSYAILEYSEEGGAGLGTWMNGYSHGVGDVNLVVYGIPANVNSLAEGELNKPSASYVSGKNRFGQGTWRGMCAPAGASAPHHYLFKMVATDLDPKALPPGLTYPELIQRLEGHALDAAVLVGLYTNP